MTIYHSECLLNSLSSKGYKKEDNNTPTHTKWHIQSHHGYKRELGNTKCCPHMAYGRSSIVLWVVSLWQKSVERLCLSRPYLGTHIPH